MKILNPLTSQLDKPLVVWLETTRYWIATEAAVGPWERLGDLGIILLALERAGNGLMPLSAIERMVVNLGDTAIPDAQVAVLRMRERTPWEPGASVVIADLPTDADLSMFRTSVVTACRAAHRRVVR